MTDAEQQLPPTPKHVQAAKASWLAPLIAIIVNFLVGRNAEDRSVIILVGVFAVLMIVVGLVFALWAIVGAFSKGPRRILFPASIGLIINGFLVYSAVDTFLLVQETAQERHAQEAIESSDDWIPAGEGWHIDRSAHFAIQFPEKWEVIPNWQDRVAVLALSPLESAEDKFRENITIVAGRVPPRTDPKAFLAEDLEDLRQSTVGFKEYGSGNKTLNGVEWSWIEYRQVAQGIETRVIANLAVRNGRIYAILCSGSPDRLHVFEELFAKSVQSIRIPQSDLIER